MKRRRPPAPAKRPGSPSRPRRPPAPRLPAAPQAAAPAGPSLELWAAAVVGTLLVGGSIAAAAMLWRRRPGPSLPPRPAPALRPGQPEPALLPGPYRTFRLTEYHVAKLPAGDVPIQDLAGQELGRISDKALHALNLEGSGQLPSGLVVNYAGEKEAAAKRYKLLPQGVLATGARGPLTPYRSLAADLGDQGGKKPWKDSTTRGGPLVPLGTQVFIKELVGLVLPDGTAHDGWCVVEDTGDAIYGAHFDLFVGLGPAPKLPSLVSAAFQGSAEIPADYDYGLVRAADYRHLRPPQRVS